MNHKEIKISKLSQSDHHPLAWNKKTSSCCTRSSSIRSDRHEGNELEFTFQFNSSLHSLCNWLTFRIFVISPYYQRNHQIIIFQISYSIIRLSEEFWTILSTAFDNGGRHLPTIGHLAATLPGRAFTWPLKFLRSLKNLTILKRPIPLSSSTEEPHKKQQLPDVSRHTRSLCLESPNYHSISAIEFHWS